VNPPIFSRRRILSLLLLSGVMPFSASVFAKTTVIDGVAPPDILLANNYSDQIDPALYLVSEKLDGVRALWDGQQLRFRSGRIIHAPAWFVAGFPRHAMDGELWIGRHNFDRLSGTVRRQVPLDAEWREVCYQLYELPSGEGDFRQRLKTLQASVAQAAVPWLQVLAQSEVIDRAALQQRLDQVVQQGGEGLVLHRADAPWQTGRSNVLLKMKPQLDAEATVIAHEPGRGKFSGMLGALLVETELGVRFQLGSGLSDALRRNPPPIGSVVTFRYRDLTATGLPKFASFLRVRERE
jgi:DNA ligase-1